MSKFKVGDKVVRTRKSSSLVMGDTYVVTEVVDSLSIKLRDGGGFGYSSAFFTLAESNERQKLSEAIDLLGRYGIGLDLRYDFPYARAVTGVMPRLRKSSGGDVLEGKDSILNYLFPTETPQQAKLKMLEAKQTRIAEEMRLLRESM